MINTSINELTLKPTAFRDERNRKHFNIPKDFQQITLDPRSDQPEFETLEFQSSQAEELRIVGDFIAIIS